MEKQAQGVLNKSKGFIGEFKEFITRGNVMDMAVGIIIGTAFTAIVTSLVNDVVMPLIGWIFGGVDFSELKYVITPAVGDVPEAALYYGNFIQSIVNFLLIALVIFLMIKAINKFHKKHDEEPEAEAEPEPSEEAVLLTEIRDLLKKDN
ncbi:MAG: large-conductance mechanosensitive channel protein MscL [Firmicutes bacterium]|nr:large-conductance mechanosensitive channel protein MscL [Bacillota bacterium]